MTTLIAIGVCADRLGHATHDDYRADVRGAAYVEQTLTVTPSSAFFVDPNKPLYVDWGHGDRVIGEIRHLERQADNLWAIGEIDTERLTDDIAANLGAADLYWSTEASDDPQLGAGRRRNCCASASSPNRQQTRCRRSNCSTAPSNTPPAPLNAPTPNGSPGPSNTDAAKASASSRSTAPQPRPREVAPRAAPPVGNTSPTGSTNTADPSSTTRRPPALRRVRDLRIRGDPRTPPCSRL